MTDERSIGDIRGDRNTLNGMDRDILESKILSEARRWLRVFPGLRQHAIQTLSYWGEPLVDDKGWTGSQRIAAEERAREARFDAGFRARNVPEGES